MMRFIKLTSYIERTTLSTTVQCDELAGEWTIYQRLACPKDPAEGTRTVNEWHQFIVGSICRIALGTVLSCMAGESKARRWLWYYCFAYVR